MVDDRERLQVAEDATELVAVMFDEGTVRCLPDGRVMFHAAEYRFPSPVPSTTDAHAYVLDRTRQTLLPLSKAVPVRPDFTLPVDPWFTASPDGTQVLFTDPAGIVSLSTLSGRIERVQLKAGGATSRPQFVAWKSPGEFSYIRKLGPRNELVLRRGETETVLSAKWPTHILGP